MLRFYNTLSRKKEEFVPIKKGKVNWYVCGPTVYNYAHIGNLRTYIFNDLLRRVLIYDQYKVKEVMNITDVGHLTSDADSGEDKMLKGAKREGKTVWEIAKHYTEVFKADLNKLNVLEPDIWSKATEHVTDMIELIKLIEKNGFAYQAQGNVYFDTSKFKNYGKLARLNLEEQQAGARIKVDTNKKNPRDFALWFTKSKFDSQEMKWDSPWGQGYPGWHIECSAMSMKYLGEQFDIHTGGIDHIPVHHTNEIAQSEAATKKKPWVKYWLHGAFLNIEQGKMAKSGQGFITLQTLEDKGYNPLHYRYFCLGAHYRMPLTFSWDALDAAKSAYEKLKARVIEIKKLSVKGKNGLEYLAKFEEYINDDINAPRALGLMWDLLKDDSVGCKDKYNLLLEFDRVLGLGLKELEKEKVPVSVMRFVNAREAARQSKDWIKSDELRDKILGFGYTVKDTKQGPSVEKN